MSERVYEKTRFGAWYHLTKHDGEVAAPQRDSDRVLAKLDEILQ